MYVLAYSANYAFQPIDSTIDLFSSDLNGVPFFDALHQNHGVCRDFLFAIVVLGDKMGRFTPRTENVFLEAMSGGKMFVIDHTYPIPRVLMTIASQNAFEIQGTAYFPRE